MRIEWEVKLAEPPVDQPPTVAFTAFADAWPRAIETEIGAVLCTFGRGKGFNIQQRIYRYSFKRDTFTAFFA